MTTKIQIHGTLPFGTMEAPIEADVVPGDQPLEAAIDHLLATNRILGGKIKSNEKKFHEKLKQEREINRILAQRIVQSKATIDKLFYEARAL